MLKSGGTMFRTFFLVTLIIIVSGCGLNSEEPVYDTASNPDGFPAMAISLLENIESGELRGFDAIAGGFGDLYTEHTDLLDSEPWRAVVDRLGSKFGYIADTLREQGIEFYRDAAEYYQLASFARPQDKQLYHRAATFETWRRAFESDAIDVASVVDGTKPDLETYLAVARFFAFGDEAHRAFFDEDLRVILHDRLRKADQLTPAKIAELDAIDHCLAVHLGLTQEPIEQRLAAFADPSIDLAACRITQVDTTSFIAEAYIVPREQVTGELTVAIRMSLSDTLGPSMNPKLNYSQLQLRPEIPSSEWELGGLVTAARQFDYPGAPASLQVSIIDHSEGRAKYLELTDGQGSFLSLNDSAMVAL
jgi:hypothetical protein